MPSNTLSRGNILNEVLLSVSLTPAQVAANSTATQTFAIPGALMTDYIDVFAQAAQVQNVIVAGCWISSAGIAAIQFLNTSAAAITPAQGTYTVNLVRPENTPLPANMV